MQHCCFACLPTPISRSEALTRQRSLRLDRKNRSVEGQLGGKTSSTGLGSGSGVCQCCYSIRRKLRARQMTPPKDIPYIHVASRQRSKAMRKQTHTAMSSQVPLCDHSDHSTIVHSHRSWSDSNSNPFDHNTELFTPFWPYHSHWHWPPFAVSFISLELD